MLSVVRIQRALWLQICVRYTKYIIRHAPPGMPYGFVRIFFPYFFFLFHFFLPSPRFPDDNFWTARRIVPKLHPHPNFLFCLRFRTPGTFFRKKKLHVCPHTPPPSLLSEQSPQSSCNNNPNNNCAVWDSTNTSNKYILVWECPNVFRSYCLVMIRYIHICLIMWV